MSHPTLGVAALAGVLLGLLAAPLSGVAEETDAPVTSDPRARAIQAWKNTCHKCHAAPDTTYDTDRAFLRQIMETT